MMLLVGILPRQQTENGIVQPESGAVISGVVVVEGTAVHPDYLRYELAFMYLDDPNPEWIVFADGDQQIVNGTLAIWDTEVGRAINAPIFPDGNYQLRLRVVKTDFNYDEFFITNIIISNDDATPTPALDETAVALTQTAISIVPTAASTNSSSFQQASPIPSLTPFPTPTLRTTPQGNEQRATPVPNNDSGGLIGQLSNAGWDRVGDAFLIGVIGAAILFGLGIFYILLRAVGRRLWRMVWHSRNSQGGKN